MSKATDNEMSEVTESPIERLSDFSDRLSPIMVKEMRQGLRQASFVILFLVLQCVLALAVISSLSAVASASANTRMETGMVISGFFFGIFAVATLIIQPLRGLNALSAEIKTSTIDLLLLTKLNAWRIVVGKWLSLNAQSALLLVAIIPYLMMRYFLGGMNLLGELLTLLIIFLMGCTATAAAVGMSAIRSVILRSIFAILGTTFLIFLLQGAFTLIEFYLLGGRMGVFGGFGATSIVTPMDWFSIVAGLLLLIGFLTHSFLEFGATRIAPPSENRSAKKRLIAITSILLIPAIFAMREITQGEFCYFALALIVPMALADALSENPNHIKPMKGRDLWLLRPGWPSGAFFGLIMVLMSLGWVIFISIANSDSVAFNSDEIQGVSQVIAVIIMIFSQPVLIIAMFRPKAQEPANVYIASMMASTCLGMVILIVVTSVSSGELALRTLFVIFPVLGFGTIDEASPVSTLSMFAVSCVYLVSAAAIGYRRWGMNSMNTPISNGPAK